MYFSRLERRKAKSLDIITFTKKKLIEVENRNHRACSHGELKAERVALFCIVPILKHYSRFDY